MSFRISNIYKSLVRQIIDSVEIMKRNGVVPEIEYFDWDAGGNESEMPKVDVVGLADWTFAENGGLWLIHAGITVSTVNDDNRFREMAIIDALHDIWGEQCVIPLRDDNGIEHSQLVVKEFEMLTAGASSKRNYRPIGLVLARTSGG